MDSWREGIFYAVAILVTLHQQYTIAADILEESSCLDADCATLDETEKHAMRILMTYDSRCDFKGL